MKSSLALKAIAFTFAATMASQAAAVSLTGTIRDFSVSHDDMELNPIGGLQVGRVETTLGADGKPVWADVSLPGFTTKANFDQWYNDVQGVNQPAAFDLPLSVNDSGMLSFSSSSFFPIDGQLLGNEGNAHNYHFTLELAGQFSFEDGDTFTFTGDDDVWVFFGNKLGIDIGGVHPAVKKSINSVGLKELGLVAGQNYALNIFFAERHTTQSNFNIETSLAITPTTPVPLPAAMPLLAAALGGLGLMGRRARRARA